MNTGDRITALRKAKKLSQGEPAKIAGVSRKIAEGRDVSLDYLAGTTDKVSMDKQTLKLIDDIEELEPSIKDKLLFPANAIIRDAKTGKAYAQ